MDNKNVRAGIEKFDEDRAVHGVYVTCTQFRKTLTAMLDSKEEKPKDCKACKLLEEKPTDNKPEPVDPYRVQYRQEQKSTGDYSKESLAKAQELLDMGVMCYEGKIENATIVSNGKVYRLKESLTSSCKGFDYATAVDRVKELEAEVEKMKELSEAEKGLLKAWEKIVRAVWVDEPIYSVIKACIKEKKLEGTT